jgi:TPR repeat protein
MSSATASADYKKGLDAYNAGDYATALREWRPLANRGNARAQNNLGHMYYNGEGIPKDYVEAYKWFNLAAAQGNVAAKSLKEIVEKRMTKQQIAEGQRLSREMIEKYELIEEKSYVRKKY